MYPALLLEAKSPWRVKLTSPDREQSPLTKNIYGRDEQREKISSLKS